MRNRDDLREAIDRAPTNLMSSPCSPTAMIFRPRFFRCFNDLMRIAIVDADHRRATRRNQVLEQAELGGEIGFDGRMIVEMITRQDL